MDEYQKFNLNPYKNINNNSNNNIIANSNSNNILPLLESNNNINTFIKGFSNEIHENLFIHDFNEKLPNPNYFQGILNEDIFKNRKFTELKNNKKLKSSNEGLNNINSLVNIMNDRNWGHENKSRGITSDASVNNNHGKIYRELGN
jgi:hypothetical protein